MAEKTKTNNPGKSFREMSDEMFKGVVVGTYKVFKE